MSSASSASWSTSSGRTASASTVRERSETAAWMRSWPKSMPTTAPAERSSESSVGGRPVAMLAGASGSECSTISPCAWRSETRLETVERDRPVTRAISARLAVPRSRRVSTTRRRLSSRNDSSDPVLTPGRPSRNPRGFVKSLHELWRSAAVFLFRTRRKPPAAPVRSSATGANRSPCSSTRAEHLGGGEAELLGVARRSPSTSSQSERRRDRRPLARAQGVDVDRRLVLVVLAPVDEHLARAPLLASCPRARASGGGARAPARARARMTSCRHRSSAC